jgi:hydrogenase-4 component B
LLFSQKKKDIEPIFPTEGHYESHAGDKVEKWLIDKPVKALRSFMGRFLFFQNGRLQSYLLYGILFIVALIFLPMLFEKLMAFLGFLKQL